MHYIYLESYLTESKLFKPQTESNIIRAVARKAYLFNRNK